ncbi:hypothetical protein ACFLYO_02915 [Chloroflexota bacterium]
MGNGRVVGVILLVVGIVIGVVVLAFLGSGVASGELTTEGAILGVGLAFLVLVAPLVGFGIVLMVQGSKDASRHQQAQQQRELLDIVQSRGQVEVRDLALEMQANPDEIRAMVHKLVGLQVFTGYINWDKGLLYSSQAAELRDLSACKNCNGEISLSGKGVLTCRFCGTEYFLS